MILPSCMTQTIRNMKCYGFAAMFAAVLIASLACSPVAGQGQYTLATQEIPVCNNILPSYLEYLHNNCILPTNGISDTCKELTKIICGDVVGDTANGIPNPCTAAPGSYVYPISNYANKGVFGPEGYGCLRDRSCKHSLVCPVSAADVASVRCQIYDPTTLSTVGSVNPNSLVAWARYIQTCYGSNYNPATTPPSTCSQLSGDLCTRPDVICDGNKTSFREAGGTVPTVVLSSLPGSCTVSSTFLFQLGL